MSDVKTVAPERDIWCDIWMRFNAMEAMRGQTGPSIQMRDLLAQLQEGQGALQTIYASAWNRLQQLQSEIEAAHTRAERLAKELGECSGGYQTMEREVAALTASVEQWKSVAGKLSAERDTLRERAERLAAELETAHRAHDNSTRLWIDAKERAERLEAALRELVELKALKEKLQSREFIDNIKTEPWRDAWNEYERRKPIAWAAARTALGAKEPT